MTKTGKRYWIARDNTNTADYTIWDEMHKPRFGNDMWVEEDGSPIWEYDEASFIVEVHEIDIKPGDMILVRLGAEAIE